VLYSSAVLVSDHVLSLLGGICVVTSLRAWVNLETACS